MRYLQKIGAEPPRCHSRYLGFSRNSCYKVPRSSFSLQCSSFPRAQALFASSGKLAASAMCPTLPLVHREWSRALLTAGLEYARAIACCGHCIACIAAVPQTRLSATGTQLRLDDMSSRFAGLGSDC